MTNDTLELLENLAWERRRELDGTDPELRELDGQYQALFRAFMEEHRHNRRLRRAVLRLLDLHGALEDRHGRLQFQMGLQMGLELGGVRLLREEGAPCVRLP